MSVLGEIAAEKTQTNIEWCNYREKHLSFIEISLWLLRRKLKQLCVNSVPWNDRTPHPKINAAAMPRLLVAVAWIVLWVPQLCSEHLKRKTRRFSTVHQEECSWQQQKSPSDIEALDSLDWKGELSLQWEQMKRLRWIEQWFTHCSIFNSKLRVVCPWAIVILLISSAFLRRDYNFGRSSADQGGGV